MANSVDLRPIDGACHCRNISFTLQFPKSETPIKVRACSCSFCVKHGGVYTSHPQAKLSMFGLPTLTSSNAIGSAPVPPIS